MARKKRSDEEYLEETEPIGVVILNNISYVMEDIGELMLDIAKLQRKKPEEFKELLETLQKGPEGLTKSVPEEIASQAMASFMALAMKAQSLKQDINGPTTGAVDSGATGPMGNINVQKMSPEQLESLGKTIQIESANISKVIEAYEKKLLKQKE